MFSIKTIAKDFIPPIFLKILRKIKSVKNKKDENLQEFFSPKLESYSQFQEDLLIDLILGRKKTGLYIDIGANDPFVNNNTQRFYQRGWRGINIEPNKIAYEKIKQNRTEDCNLNIAISENTGELTFYLIGEDSSISTLDYKQALKMEKITKGKITTCTVKTKTLKDVLDDNAENRQIDFMSVDAEGHDLEVLKSNDWNKYRPFLILVESNIKTKDIIKYMEQNGYLYIFSNQVNALFIDNRIIDKEIFSN